MTASSEDHSRGAAADRPGAGLRPPRRALRALPLCGKPAPARRRRDRALHLDVASGARGPARLRPSPRVTASRSEIRTYRRRAFDRATRYQLHVEGSDDALVTLVEAGVLDARHAPLERPPRRVVARACCRRAYLRGRISRGRLADGPSLAASRASRGRRSPARGSRPPSPHEEGIPLGAVERRAHAVAYAKSWDAIESLLAAMGAAETVLALEERAVSRATRRAGEPARERRPREPRAHEPRGSGQLAAAGGSGRRDGSTAAPRAARGRQLRLRHPTLSLRELAARTDPPRARRRCTAACVASRSSLAR